MILFFFSIQDARFLVFVLKQKLLISCLHHMGLAFPSREKLFSWVLSNPMGLLVRNPGSLQLQVELIPRNCY